MIVFEKKLKKKKKTISFLQRDLAEEAVAALKSVHGTVYQAINSAGLCKMILFLH